MTEQNDNARLPLRRLGSSRPSRGGTRRRSNPAGRTGRWIISHPWAIVGVAVVVWFGTWVVGSRSEPHHIKAAFPTAFNLTPGLDVAVDGLDAGKVSDVEYVDGRAVVELAISEEYWPLPQGTTATSRYGTTIGSGTRRVDLQLGPENAAKIPEDGIIGTKDTRAAVDVDAVLNAASSATRKDATSLAERADRALTGSEQDLNESISDSPRNLKDINGFLKDLGSDAVALSGLITNADRLSRTLATRSGQVSDLVTVSSRTFQAFADRSTDLQRTLDGVRPAMGEARTTLARVDDSLGGLTELVDDLEPGAKRLKPLAKAASPALRNLSSIVPSALSTVRTTTRVAPELNTLLTNGVPFTDKVQRVTSELEPMAHCVAPYAPEAVNALGGLGSWQSAYTLADPNPPEALQYWKASDSPFPYHGRKENGFFRQHAVRARPSVALSSLHSNPLSPEAFVKLSGKKYAYPRPPGLGSASGPRFMPECDITQDVLDPSKDREPRSIK